MISGLMTTLEVDVVSPIQSEDPESGPPRIAP
jgi:hypothetical protein